MPGYALVSVSDKRNISTLAKHLIKLGYKILSTSGTAAHLKESGCILEDISSYTKFPEILGGRVKSLHPIIYSGILAKRNEGSHLQELQEHHISFIDLVVVNFYDFAAYSRKYPQPNPNQNQKDQAHEETYLQAADHIDIGGPCMLRAAAKNWQHVIALNDPDDYGWFMDATAHNHLTLHQRRLLAHKAFLHCKNYDEQIAAYLSTALTHNQPKQDIHVKPATKKPMESYLASISTSEQTLRYGENHQQEGYLYPSLNLPLSKLQGKELSYNNHLDMDSALKILLEYRGEDICVIIKHTIACGLASKSAKQIHTTKELFDKALAGDPRSAFGGIIAFSCEVDKAAAECINEGFYEVLMAPSFHKDALHMLEAKPNLRVMNIETLKTPSPSQTSYNIRSLLTGLLVQSVSHNIDHTSNQPALNVVSHKQPSQREWQDLLFALKLAKHQASNSVVISRDSCLIAHGSGHTSRIDACEFALSKCPNTLKGAVLASDGFFPFPDVIEKAAEAGIQAVIAPKGSRKDQDSIDMANKHNMSLVFSDLRYFKH